MSRPEMWGEMGKGSHSGAPEPELSRWLAWGCLEDGNLQVGWAKSLCQGLIQGSGIKPLAWGLNWNFTCTEPSGTRGWAVSGTVCAVGSEKVLNPIVDIKVKEEMRGPSFLLEVFKKPWVFKKLFYWIWNENILWKQPRSMKEFIPEAKSD